VACDDSASDRAASQNEALATWLRLYPMDSIEQDGTGNCVSK